MSNQEAMTLVDAISIAYDKLGSNFADKTRLARGKDIVIGMLLQRENSYQIKSDAHKEGIYAVTNDRNQTYIVNLDKPYLRCNCPDVVDLGVISCKHVVACSLLREAIYIYKESKREREREKESSSIVHTVRADITEAQEILASMLLSLISDGIYDGAMRYCTIGEVEYAITISKR